MLVLLGGWSTVSLIDVLLHGGTYLSRQPIAASFGLFGGLWPRHHRVRHHGPETQTLYAQLLEVRASLERVLPEARRAVRL